MKPFIFITCPLLILSLNLFAESIQLTPIKDNTLYETFNGATTNGAGDRLFIGKTGPSGNNALRRALLTFDASAIPSDAFTQSVSLQVNITNSPLDASPFAANLRFLLVDGKGMSNDNKGS